LTRETNTTDRRKKSVSKDNSGVVNIHGKQYETVALRVKKFREKHPSYRLLTEIQHRDEECVVMLARIANEQGEVLATGHSEEYRHTSQINKTSALENAETSAIGRALAALGLGGTEFATADEVANAISQQGAIKPTDGARSRVEVARRKMVEDTAILVKDALREERDFDAYAHCENFTDPDEKVYLWSFLDSKERRRLKAQAEVANKQGATA
jgi:hypothetical protein